MTGIEFAPTAQPMIRRTTVVLASPLRKFVLWTIPFATACAATPLPVSTIDVTSASTTPDWGMFQLGRNDQVHLAVYGHPQFTSPDGGVRIAPDGTLSVPLLGGVKVLGKTVEEARLNIQTRLAEFLIEPSVTLSVVEYSSRRFYLFGEVNKAGPYVMDRPITALEALSMGEGFMTGANRETVVILRRHDEDDVEVIQFNAEIPGPDGLVQVHPDDLLFVSRNGVGNFSERVLPYLQGLGFTLSQMTSLTLAIDRL